MKEGVGFSALLAEAVGGLFVQPLAIAPVVGPGGRVAEIHFVIRFIAQKGSFSKIAAILG